MYDLAILGGGPAGVAAGVYASRKQLKTVFITKDFHGQSSVSDSIENWIGDITISGLDLSKKLENHLRAYAENIIDIKTGVEIKKLEKNPSGIGFLVTTDKESYEAKTVLITTGSRRRKLTVPGAEEYDGKGIVYCASCDGPLFSGKDVVVIGGGNAGFESAAQLLAYCKSVTLLHRNAEFKADPVTIETVTKDPKMTAIPNADITEVYGDKFVQGIKYKKVDTGEVVDLPVSGVFVEIGATPNTSYAEDLIGLTSFGQVIINPKDQRATIDGVWAAGDCTDGLYHQNNIAAGDAVRALEDIYIYLKTQ